MLKTKLEFWRGYIGCTSITRVNMGKQDIQGYTRYTVLLGYSWVHRIYMGTHDT